VEETVSRHKGRIESDERQLFEELYRPLRRFAAVIVPVGVEPDDLVQEALVRVLKKHRLDELDYPAAYLRRTMLNLTANERRRRGVQRSAMNRWAASATNEATQGFPSDLAELMRLAPQARAVLYLAEVERYRYDEIAEMLGCSSAATRKRASKARKHLRTALSAEGS
jgi:RNA polymerase sigma factor (sigma-70 family)